MDRKASTGKIVIVTSGQPSANPRVTKEAMFLSEQGFKVVVVYAPLSPWADKFDRKLFRDTPDIEWVMAGSHRKSHPWRYKLVRLRRRMNAWLAKYPVLAIAPQRAFSLYSQELERRASSIRADLYIGHNLGALPAAVKAAKKWRAACAFDAEDYHRGEAAAGSPSYRLTVQMEERYMPALRYMTAASPMIAAEYGKLFPGKKITTINNVFSRRQGRRPSMENGNVSLRLVWISQVVGPNRGIETVIGAMNRLPDCSISLHLVGNCSDSYRWELIHLADRKDSVQFIKPVELDELFRIAADYDIGLATEVPYCRNREICLTNKLFIYLLSGNCILASDTPAQRQLLEEHPGIGLLYRNGDAEGMAAHLRKLYTDRELLHSCRSAAFQAGETLLNWEVESEKLLGVIEPYIKKGE